MYFLTAKKSNTVPIITRVNSFLGLWNSFCLFPPWWNLSLDIRKPRNLLVPELFTFWKCYVTPFWEENFKINHLEKKLINFFGDIYYIYYIFIYILYIFIYIYIIGLCPRLVSENAIESTSRNAARNGSNHRAPSFLAHKVPKREMGSLSSHLLLGGWTPLKPGDLLTDLWLL